MLQVTLFTSLILLFASVSAGGSSYKVKAAYLYQFTKFTQWPNELFSDKDEPIRICVLGRNPFANLLDGFTKKTSQKRPLSVEYLSSLETITRCQIIFISQSEEKRLAQIFQRLAHVPVLTVSDIDGFARRGGIIGFVPKLRKVGIEINVEASKIAGTKLSSKLLKVATLVPGRLALNGSGVSPL
ncbi:YfiR family protein [sulfur-oxidizing endosymbiont of Gigantopelta aegis]|uniref:YfiR family protein n=1 Tax=sulfur-oxidizing endosymbiont of Gigantopelta aegis TaxID=2794934 RepID=UPI0018DE511F|nr:YfiR family protein [sulfur-oxidizing endosymbiont of Gigantopelta aegis]